MWWPLVLRCFPRLLVSFAHHVLALWPNWSLKPTPSGAAYLERYASQPQLQVVLQVRSAPVPMQHSLQYIVRPFIVMV